MLHSAELAELCWKTVRCGKIDLFESNQPWKNLHCGIQVPQWKALEANFSFHGPQTTPSGQSLH